MFNSERAQLRKLLSVILVLYWPYEFEKNLFVRVI